MMQNTQLDAKQRRPHPNPPTGADGDHATFCRLCEAHCGLVATVRDGRVVKLAPDRANPHSQGHVCVKGTQAHAITYDRDRVLKPLKRVGGAGDFVEVSWDEALDDIAARLKTLRNTHGPEALASYLGNPTSFASEHFTTQLELMASMGSTRQYGASSQDTSARLAANYFAYGAPWTTGVPDLPSCDFLVIIGGNPLVSNGSLMWAPRIAHDLDAIARRGRVVIVDPRRSETAARYEHLPIRPNGDVWLLLGMLRTLLDEDLIAAETLAHDVSGWDQLRAQLQLASVEDCASRCDVPAEQIRALARDVVAAKRASIYSRIGICRGPYATLVNFLITAFNALSGSYSREGGTMFGREIFPRQKAKPGGYGETCSRTGKVPSVAGFLPSATMPDDILIDGDDKVRALLMSCGNPLLSAPGGERLEAALQALELFVSFDLYVNETNRHAHYILPGLSFLERADAPVIGFGFMIRPFIQYTDAVIAPLGDARNEYDVMLAIVQRMGIGAPAAARWRRVLGKFRLAPRPLTLIDAGLRLGPVGDRFGLRRDGWSLNKLRQHPHGVMVNVPHGFESWHERIAYADRRIHVWHERIAGECSRLLAEAGTQPRFRLLSIREIRSLNSWMHNVDRLVRSQLPVLTMHPLDADELGVANGDLVRISTAAAALEVPVQRSDEVVRGAVCYPHGWGHRENHGGWQRANRTVGVNINRLLGLGVAAIEFVSGSSLIDGLEVSIEKVPDAAATAPAETAIAA